MNTICIATFISNTGFEPPRCRHALVNISKLKPYCIETEIFGTFFTRPLFVDSARQILQIDY
jgi:hypothetical protein